ncbi:TIGR04283 family arsenosugar biosynthesis glycosyltransferase [Amphiplicatus metriothermophilus]|uniref:Transferase 2, rSAM/selenodomain-associated n=1 Tax=Amphiplicatus metriothermophilus TaxID=1519374 RepID=A0A239PSZ5_9PROT|nr:TIGR04283 family arsenosugar biosynthesis glycosyltransferase [Amphiplicatus metriothermophilus]MBB5519221.1 rSAM/selenodomain-associated transferase 2 [Amphiplicatus metriothermophilus]SNT73290.1 transferase 2, rSAM/selenodomain-associated [Amphiplicatus metriothermophilus]
MTAATSYPKISVIIPTLDAARELPATLTALVPAAIDGLVKEVIIADGGSQDETMRIAQEAGARVVAGPRGRGAQLAQGAAAARGAWLLFLHADTVLETTWAEEARAFLGAPERAGVFTLAFDAKGFAPRVVAAGAMARTRLLAAPYGDQGLLIARALYEEIGGFRPLPLFEDLDIIERLIKTKGRRALHVFRAKAVTSAARYERDGYMRRVLKNAWCLALYRFGASPARIAEIYAR